MKLISVVFFSLIFSLSAYSQKKIEFEKDIPRNQVPEKAIQTVNYLFPDIKKKKWFFEVSTTNKSYEAKLKSANRSWYSVEFDTSGILEDVEQTIKRKAIPDSINSKIENYFSNSYTKSKILKIQLQLIGTPELLKQYLLSPNQPHQITTNYEIEFYGKTSDENKIWEIRFDSQGEVLQKREIIQNPAHNLTY